MNGYLQSLIARGRGRPPAVRPIKRLRWTSGGGEQSFAVAAEEQTVALRKAPAALTIEKHSARMAGEILKTSDAAFPAEADDRANSSFAPQIKPAPAIEQRPAASTFAFEPASTTPPARFPRNPQASGALTPRRDRHEPRADVREFVRWLETEPAPREQADDATDRGVAVAHRTETAGIGPDRAEPHSQTHVLQAADTHIHIGRVELISMTPVPARSTKAAAKPPMSLDEYLRRRDGRRQ